MKRTLLLDAALFSWIVLLTTAVLYLVTGEPDGPVETVSNAVDPTKM